MSAALRSFMAVTRAVRKRTPSRPSEHARSSLPAFSRLRLPPRARPDFAGPVERTPSTDRAPLRGPRRLDKHLAGVRISLLADSSVARRAIAGLATLRRQSEVATQLLRRLEPRDIADRGQDGRATTGRIPGIVIRRTTRGFSSASPMIVMLSLASYPNCAPGVDRRPTIAFSASGNGRPANILAGLRRYGPSTSGSDLHAGSREDVLGANDLLENAHALNVCRRWRWVLSSQPRPPVESRRREVWPI